MHTSVLLAEVLEVFAPLKMRIFVDGTLGAGGHAEAILQAHPELEIFIGIDQDPDALGIAKQRLKPWESKLKILYGNFSAFEPFLEASGISSIDGMLLDLGVSSMQLDRPEKGFSFMKDGPLDMRMGPQETVTAAELVNTASEEELGRIFREYGEEKQWRAAAKLLIAARSKKPLQTTQDLVEALKPAFSFWNKKGLHPMTLVFQALRIAVNKELDVLEAVLPTAIDWLSPQGRLAVISFHSLEDRIVKNALRFAASDKVDTSGIGGVFLDKDPLIEILTRKPIVAAETEVRANPRSRSAKLRAIEKL